MEEAFCKSQYFDYDAELKEFVSQLDKRKAKMDDAKKYLEEKEEQKLVQEGYAQDVFEQEMQENIDIADSLQ